MDSKQKNRDSAKILDRLKGTCFPPAAVVGALASFVGTAFSPKGGASEKPSPNAPLVQLGVSERAAAYSGLEMEYRPVLVLGSGASAHAFRRSISGIAVDSADKIYVLGDGDVCIFNFQGIFDRSFKAPEKTLCVAVGVDERIYLGRNGRLDIYDSMGIRVGGFNVGEDGKGSAITAIKLTGREILVADASHRCIRRYTEAGNQTGVIGTQNKTGGFMLPNRFLDMAVDGSGMVRATDTGRHRVSSWHLDGTPAGHFGKFGLRNPEDFVGCCNPVNIAVTPDGKIVTAEKVSARVKVFDTSGKLVGLIGAENFDPMCTHLHLAADSRGRVLVADPVRLEVKVFSSENKSGGKTQI